MKSPEVATVAWAVCCLCFMSAALINFQLADALCVAGLLAGATALIWAMKPLP